jgi:hypothetical protein
MLKIWDSGLDWLTLTKSRIDEDFSQAQSFCETLMRDLGMERGEYEQCGQNGYIGVKVGKIFSGIRDDGLIIRASSSEAKYIEKKIRERNIAWKCTRADLQVTAKIEEEDVEYISGLLGTLTPTTGNAENANRSNKAAYQVGGGFSGGTIGSRSSARYLRFYNKSLEQDHRVEDNLWRFEVEFKELMAREVFGFCMKSVASKWVALGIVKAEFERHGVNMDWVVSGEVFELPSCYEPSSVEKSLTWLESHVRATVTKLKNGGYEEATRRALGLDAGV